MRVEIVRISDNSPFAEVPFVINFKDANETFKQKKLLGSKCYYIVAEIISYFTYKLLNYLLVDKV